MDDLMKRVLEIGCGTVLALVVIATIGYVLIQVTGFDTSSLLPQPPVIYQNATPAPGPDPRQPPIYVTVVVPTPEKPGPGNEPMPTAVAAIATAVPEAGPTIVLSDWVGALVLHEHFYTSTVQVVYGQTFTATGTAEDIQSILGVELPFTTLGMQATLFADIRGGVSWGDIINMEFQTDDSGFLTITIPYRPCISSIHIYPDVDIENIQDPTLRAMTGEEGNIAEIAFEEAYMDLINSRNLQLVLKGTVDVIEQPNSIFKRGLENLFGLAALRVIESDRARENNLAPPTIKKIILIPVTPLDGQWDPIFCDSGIRVQHTPTRTE